MGQKVLIVVIALVMVGWGVSRREKEKAATSDAVLADARVLFSQMEGYQDNKGYIDDVIAQAHEQAFSYAYQSGRTGRRFRPSEPASFSEDKYLATLFMHAGAIVQSDINKLALPKDQNQYKTIDRNLEGLKKKLGVKDLNQL